MVCEKKHSESYSAYVLLCFFFFQAEDGIRDIGVTGVQTCALPILGESVPPIGRAVRVGWPWLVLAVALATRLWGIGWQLPSALHYDELKYVEWAGAVAAGEQTETDFRNPSLYRHLLLAEYRLAALLGATDDDRSTAILQFHLARATSAVFGAVACLLTALAAAPLVPNGQRPWAGGLGGGPARLGLGWGLARVHVSHHPLDDA